MTRNALSSYAQNGVETGVDSATPHQLIAMLYEGALLAVSTARIALIQGKVPERGKAISHAIAIISGGLKGSIDMKAGGAMAQDLNGLYEYMAFRLVAANVEADLAPLNEVEGLLKGLQGAWAAIEKLPAVKAHAGKPTSPRLAASYGAA